MNVFLDTNVLYDVLAKREPFLYESAEVWTLAETERIRAFISALSLPNLFYSLRKAWGREAARKALHILRDVYTVVPMDVQLVNEAIDSDMRDFEDAIQLLSALRCNAKVLVTRNPIHFAASKIPVLTPTQFLAEHFPE